MNIYEINAEALELEALIQESNGEITPEIEERLRINQENFNFKLDNYCKFIKHLDLQIQFGESEIDRIKQLINNKTNLIEKLEHNIVESLKVFGTKDRVKDIWRYEIGTFKLSTRTSKSVKILDESVIEDKFKKIQLSNLTVEQKNNILIALNLTEGEVNLKEEFSKTKIKEAIDAGENVIGAELTTKQSLQMR